MYIIYVRHVYMHLQASTLHAVIGLVALALQFTQILGSLCRPSPKSEHRPTFNVIHRTQGIVSCITAGKY